MDNEDEAMLIEQYEAMLKEYSSAQEEYTGFIPEDDDIFASGTKHPQDHSQSTSGLETPLPLSQPTQITNTNVNQPSQTASKSPETSLVLATDSNPSLVNEPSQIIASDVSQVTRKRLVRELFGDVDDIDEFDLVEHKKKKSLPTNEQIIERILMMREQEKLFLEQDPTFKNLEPKKTFNYEDNISFVEPKYSSITCRNSHGNKFYVRYHSRLYMDEEKRVTECDGLEKIRSSDCKYFTENFEKTLTEADGILAEMNTQIPPNNSTVNDNDSGTDLWVETYKPKSYLELLSDESSNRCLLRWLKAWDKIVFNRVKKPRVKATSNGHTNNFANSGQNKWSKFGNFDKSAVEIKLDEIGRPEWKVALLCGAPGLGKTTLAHIAAKHCGYNVVEINASDDRSVDVFRNTLENATQMQSVLDAEKRPNCIIFDEIDGAPTATIEFLIKYITNQPKKTPGIVVATRRKKSSKSGILKRPIICICNDLYASSLRSLRQNAYVINFPTLSSGKLAERLLHIARHQKIRTNLSTLIYLAERSGNDIRSCLSTLHFFKSKTNQLRLIDVHGAKIGEKDMHTNLFEVWKSVFHIDRREKIDEVTGGHVNLASAKHRMAEVLRLVYSFGNYDLLTNGVFENYLNVNFKDVNTLKNVAIGSDWFSWIDEMSNKIYGEQNFSLLAYVPYAFVKWNYLFATHAYTKLAYPSTGSEMRTKTQRNQATVRDVLSDMSPSMRAYNTEKDLTMDTLPYLMEIIKPTLRNVNLALLSNEEKRKLRTIVDIMIDYNLTYVQERCDNGVYTFKIDPPVDGLLTFLTKNEPTDTTPINPSSNTVHNTMKQLIAREIELEKVRRFQHAHAQQNKLLNSTTMIERPLAGASNLQLDVNVKMVNFMQQRIRPAKPVGDSAGIKVKKVARDFFGRVVVKTKAQKKAEGPVVLHSDVWYHFKEGYNNAVRRNLKISDL